MHSLMISRISTYTGKNISRSLLHVTLIETYIYDSFVGRLKVNSPADLSAMTNTETGQLARTLCLISDTNSVGWVEPGDGYIYNQQNSVDISFQMRS